MPVLKSGLYWRQSKWNARRCVPAILATNGHTVRLSSADAVAFDAPCAQVSARFSKLQTLTLTVAGTQYDLVGKPANLSPAFSQAQRAELLDADRVVSAAGDLAGTGLAPLAALGGLGAIAGAAGTLFDATSMVRNIAPWKQILPAVGVRVS